MSTASLKSRVSNDHRCGSISCLTGFRRNPLPRSKISSFNNSNGISRVRCNTESSQITKPMSTVMQFYNAWNRRDFDAALDTLAEDCVYEDVVFLDPFVGKKSLRTYFEDIVKYLDEEVQFKIDDMSEDPSGKVGLLWSLFLRLHRFLRAGRFRHVEIGDIPIPFSRGCSFFRLNKEGKISFVRDVVEPTIKPGHNAMKVMSLVVPLLKRLGPYADINEIKQLPTASYLVWALYGVYLWITLFSTSAPGVPGWQASSQNLQGLLHESMNIFYINIAQSAVGLDLMQSVAEHPVDEAVFNFVAAWGLLFLPVMLSDSRSQKMQPQTKWGLWIGTWFLTNFFFLPYNAMRLAPSMAPDIEKPTELPSWSRLIAGVGGFIGTFSILWAVYGRPEYGDLTARLDHLMNSFYHDRVFFAFVEDICLFSIFQIVLLNRFAGPNRYIPFVGLIYHLFTTKNPLEDQ